MEIMLFALRGNLKNFFAMGLPDEVCSFPSFSKLQMFLQLFARPALYLLERSSNIDNARLTSVILNVLASLLSGYPYVFN